METTGELFVFLVSPELPHLTKACSKYREKLGERVWTTVQVHRHTEKQLRLTDR